MSFNRTVRGQLSVFTDDAADLNANVVDKPPVNLYVGEKSQDVEKECECILFKRMGLGPINGKPPTDSRLNPKAANFVPSGVFRPFGPKKPGETFPALETIKEATPEPPEDPLHARVNEIFDELEREGLVTVLRPQNRYPTPPDEEEEEEEPEELDQEPIWIIKKHTYRVPLKDLKAFLTNPPDDFYEIPPAPTHKEMNPAPMDPEKLMDMLASRDSPAESIETEASHAENLESPRDAPTVVATDVAKVLTPTSRANLPSSPEKGKVSSEAVSIPPNEWEDIINELTKPVTPPPDSRTPSSTSEPLDAPPDLVYPEVEPGEIIKIPDSAMEDCQPPSENPATKEALPDLEKVSLADSPMPDEVQETVIKYTLAKIQQTLEEVTTGLAAELDKKSMQITEALANEGLLQATYYIGILKAAGKPIEAEYWQERIRKALDENQRFRQANFAKVVSTDHDGDVEMLTHLVDSKGDTGDEGTWKPMITCWVHLELMCIFPTM